MENEKVIPSDLKFTVIRLLSSLRILSLGNNNLSNKCFPKDLSCLAMLETLCLDGNPIVSMPNCVRTLPRLKELSMNCCEDLTSIENPPCTLSCLSVNPRDIYNPSIKKIKFDLEMSPLTLLGDFEYILPCEIDDMLKIQDMASVEEKVLHSLGWTYLKFTKELVVRTFKRARPIQQISSNWEMYYEFGIFSTFYKGKEMSDWIDYRSKGPSISFTIPSSINNLRGLNFLCIVKKTPHPRINGFVIPSIKISNITETHTWVYRHHIDRVKFDGNKHYYEDSGEGEESYEDAEEYCLSFLSHWMFGPNEMKVGDHIIINVRSRFFQELILECGIGLVYDDDGGKIGEEEDVLGYYKSWNHIIGGDLYPFQITTGEYDLDNHRQLHRTLSLKRNNV